MKAEAALAFRYSWAHTYDIRIALCICWRGLMKEGWSRRIILLLLHPSASSCALLKERMDVRVLYQLGNHSSKRGLCWGGVYYYCLSAIVPQIFVKWIMNSNAAAFSALLHKRKGYADPHAQSNIPPTTQPGPQYSYQSYGGGFSLPPQQHISSGSYQSYQFFPAPPPPQHPPRYHGINPPLPPPCPRWPPGTFGGRPSTPYQLQPADRYLGSHPGNDIRLSRYEHVSIDSSPRVSVSKKSIENFYCDPCDKEFTQKSQYDAHLSTHEVCKFQGCSFQASKKVVSAHFHSSHGQYSGSGVKVINVEGQKFKVLMGTNPEEVEQWREARRKKFPTTENVKKKSELKLRIEDAGGLGASASTAANCSSGRTTENCAPTHVSSANTLSKSFGTTIEARNYGRDNAGANSMDEENKEADIKPKTCFLFLKSKCRKGDTCKYSHQIGGGMAEERASQRCSNFSKGKCQYGDSCRFSHDLNAPAPAKRKAGDTPESGARKVRKVGGLNLPVPFGAPGTSCNLLKKLLEEQVEQEENTILQCIRLLHRNHFLQKSS